MKDTIRTIDKRTAALISLCFLLTSIGYLSWTYHMLDLIPSKMAELLTLSAGYLMQAAGIGLFSYVLHRRFGGLDSLFMTMLILFLLSLVPAAFSIFVLAAVVSGLFMNFVCGMIAGYYLYSLTGIHHKGSTALTLGAGYSSSVVASWILSLIDGGALYNSVFVLLICLALACAAYFLSRKQSWPASVPDTENEPAESGEIVSKKLVLSIGGLILLFSIVNSCGFGFPSSDINGGITIEFTRLFYAVGLLVAGYLNHRDRRYGAVCALTALIIPFVILSLKGETVPLICFWFLSYFTFGFYSIYRIVIFTDIAAEKHLPYLAGCGLLIGRIGDAAGEALHYCFSENILYLVISASFLFAASAILFVYVYSVSYLQHEPVKETFEGLFNRFAAQHDLSFRERDVLRLLLEEKTNAEIADTLSVSESTVKFHVHNLLQKTGCRNRVMLLSVYTEESMRS